MVGRMAFVYGLIVSFLGILVVGLIYYFWRMQDHSNLDSPVSLKAAQRGGKQNREHLRADVNWPVSLETSDGPVAAQIKNISVGGAFICCPKPLPVGETFQLTMTGPDNDPLKGTAKVVWSNVNVPEGKVINRGMGVRFIKMSDRHIQLVRQICQENA